MMRRQQNPLPSRAIHLAHFFACYMLFHLPRSVSRHRHRHHHHHPLHQPPTPQALRFYFWHASLSRRPRTEPLAKTKDRRTNPSPHPVDLFVTPYTPHPLLHHQHAPGRGRQMGTGNIPPQWMQAPAPFPPHLSSTSYTSHPTSSSPTRFVWTSFAGSPVLTASSSKINKQQQTRSAAKLIVLLYLLTRTALKNI
jgi:hypothetical protein